MKAVKMAKYTTAIAVLLTITAAAFSIVVFNEREKIQPAYADDFITLTKTPSATQVPAGTNVTYTYTITNIQNESGFTITGIVLTDNPLGAITCPHDELAVGESMTCTANTVITHTTYNHAHVTGIFQGIGDNLPTEVNAYADAAVYVLFNITKTANPATVTEEGTPVNYTVAITNVDNQDFYLESLVDDIYGDLNGQGDCVTPQYIAASESYSCTFTEIVPCDKSPRLIDIVTATGTYPPLDQRTPMPITNSASATVNIACQEPSMDVAKTANPTSITEDTDVNYTVTVTNNTGFEAELTALTDDVYGNLNGQGNCAIGGTINDRNAYACTFPGEVACEDEPSLTDTVTAQLTYTEDDGNLKTLSDEASATVAVACEDEPENGDDNGREVIEPGLATIHGKVYDDANQNGILDIGESGIASVTVALLSNNSALSTDQTDANGNFAFRDLDPGTYALRETDPPGFASSTPNDIAGIIVAANDSSYHLFGDYKIAAQAPTTPVAPTTTPTTPAAPTASTALPTTGPGDNPYPLFAALALIPLLAAGYAFYSYKRK